MPDILSLNEKTVADTVKDLPRIAQLALGYAAKLKRGTLDITLPDGRVLRCGGEEPGPAAAMTIRTYSFAWRLVNAGDIGIAEADMRHESDTPDLTTFLYLFCVNHELISAILANKPAAR